MNSKKITALALAALMAVGSTGTVFAVPANGNALDFYEAGVESTRLYKEVDGVLVPFTNFAPGNAIYIRLDEQTDVESKDAKKMNLYATWKVGEDYVEDLDIVYKKGAIGATTYSVKVGDVTLNLAGPDKADIVTAINANAALVAKLAEDAKKDAKKTEGFIYDDKYSATLPETLHIVGNTGFKDGTAYYAADEVAAWMDAYVDDNGLLDGKDAAKFSIPTAGLNEVYGTNGDTTGTVPGANTEKNAADYYLSTVDADQTTVTYLKKAATVAELKDAALVEAVAADTYVVKADHTVAAVTEVTDVAPVYVVDGEIVAEAALETAAVEAAATAAEKNVKVVTDNEYGYFAKITTKSSTTTKTIDLAGDLFIGRNKSSADGFDESAHFALDVTLSNRGTGAVGSPDYDIKVDGDIQIDPDKKAVLQFADEAEEVVIEFGDGIGYFEFNAKGQKALNFAYTLDFNEEIADMFPDANLDFITWKAAPATNKTGTLYLYADEDTFIYELPSSSNAATAVLKEVKNAKYNEDEGAWEIRTRKLVGYVISDKELDVETVTVDSSASTGSSTGNNNSGKPNPDTGR